MPKIRFLKWPHDPVGHHRVFVGSNVSHLEAEASDDGGLRSKAQEGWSGPELGLRRTNSGRGFCIEREVIKRGTWQMHRDREREREKERERQSDCVIQSFVCMFGLTTHCVSFSAGAQRLEYWKCFSRSICDKDQLVYERIACQLAPPRPLASYTKCGGNAS